MKMSMIKLAIPQRSKRVPFRNISGQILLLYFLYLFRIFYTSIYLSLKFRSSKDRGCINLIKAI